MIQEIAPHKLNNHFENHTLQSEDAILFYENGKLGVKLEGEELFFYAYEELPAQLQGEENFQYLLELDGRAIWLYNGDKNKLNDNITYISRTDLRHLRPKELTFAAITAMHLIGWYENNRFCGRCGAKLRPGSKERSLVCTCGNVVYPRINPAVIVAVTDGDRLLLTKYRGGTYRHYALIAGFTEIGETVEETVAREVMEEAGVHVKNITYYRSQPWGFTDTLLMGYFCELDGCDKIKMDAEELSVAEWVKREDLDVTLDDLSLTNEMMCKFKDEK